MPALIPGYEYDIFISYRHNDNVDGWVTNFVQHLENELRTTLKDPVSVYFDKNPDDGLLETHNVGKSLESKLKCLIFIPVISQTYCDPKSFAWAHEFCEFNQLIKADQIGALVTLATGNISSRILPVKIHDLDPEDKTLLENETGEVLRPIEFIYKEPGVNRPLDVDDDRKDNQNRTDYRNQVNKVANAVKEILLTIRQSSPGSTPSAKSAEGSTKQEGNPKRTRKVQIGILLGCVVLGIGGYLLYPKLFVTNAGNAAPQSIAVLSFVDMSPEKDQEYLGDGIAEEILNALTKIKGLKVIGRTSSFSFKGKSVDLKTIGETLGATAILEGSVQKYGNKIKITAQLINAADESHIWSERYDSEAKDIFLIQEQIAVKITEKMKGTLSSGPRAESAKAPTENLEAYEMLLRARYFRMKGFDGQLKALGYCERAIALDSLFGQAHAELSYIYFHIAVFGLANPDESMARAKAAALRAVALDPNSYYAFNLLGYISLTADWDTESYVRYYEKAVSLGLPLPDQWHGYYEQWFLGIPDNAVNDALILLERDPLSVDALVHLSRTSLGARQYERVIEVGLRTLELTPGHGSIFRHMSEAYIFSGQPEKAVPMVEQLMDRNPNYAPQNFVAMHVKMGNRKKALDKFNELKNGLTPAKRAICYIHLGEIDSAFASMEDAVRQKDIHLLGATLDPNFDAVRGDPRLHRILKLTNAME